ncbi:2-amino-4-hydroxy-6-hydroxymethyldihydropteridine diphosphokinase [Nodosilinea nodulosa]|uniref:2-amino-4-hydroxy-6- hydroxymethyldihydropteridine diphosphokinase n=1 Tax=Nodosilinea nodulosa TaxID=416001 RepID=UPI0002DD03F0|nr:2-amino-4-hydroxy-6-hydroxymethyldihydropteridine diphosphokinase [Nodosilinea nodulosa]
MDTIPCAIALGSNLGDSQRILQAALAELQTPPSIELVAQSSLYQTVPIGPVQPDILNACALIKTTLSPQNLLHRLLHIEQHFGRVRRQRWGPRTLDLDLIFYGQVRITEPDLHIPHPRLRERAFVLIPLAEIAPNWCDPVSGQSVKTLCDAVDPAGVKRLNTVIR